MGWKPEAGGAKAEAEGRCPEAEEVSPPDAESLSLRLGETCTPAKLPNFRISRLRYEILLSWRARRDLETQHLAENSF